MVRTTSGGNPFGSSITYPYLSASLQGIIFPQRIRIGGDGSDGAYTAPAGSTNISGIKQYTSLSVPVGATLNLTDNTYIFCQGAVSIDGSITRSTFATPVFAAQNGESGACGNRAMGGRMGSSFYRMQTFRACIGGGAGGFGGEGPRTGIAGAYGLGGSGGGGGAGYSQGGFGGIPIEGTSSAPAGTTSGGFGGCGLYIECLGNITITGTVTISGTNGNGGSNGDQGAGGGGGGGSFYCFALGNANLTGTFNSIGGDGGAGGATTAGGGGGGGGGYIHLGYQGSLTANTLTINVTGGSGGTGGGGAGSNGSNGSSDIYQLKAY